MGTAIRSRVLTLLVVVTLVAAESAGVRRADAAGAPVAGGAGAPSAPESASVGSVSAGGLHSCGVRADGRVACWGANDAGQATPPEGSFLAVSAGAAHACGIRVDGTLACWGAGEAGQTSPPPGTYTAVSAAARYACALAVDGQAACWGDDQSATTEPPPGPFRQVAAADSHACAVRFDGTVACWGSNWYGQSTPPDGPFRAVTAGAVHTCGIRTDGTVACWGVTLDPTLQIKYRPFNFGQASPPEGTFEAVSAADHHTCGIRGDGTVACWGAQDHEEPPWHVDTGQADPPAGTFTAVSSGRGHTCAVRTDGTAACWGSNSVGQAAPPAGRFVGAAVSAGFGYTCATATGGTVSCWGWDAAGEALPPGDRFRAVSAGRVHTCAIRVDGTLACWGADDARTAPPAGVFRSVTAGNAHTCALRIEGTVACWGPSGTWPVPDSTFVAVSAGYRHACGVRTDGSLACWGTDLGPVPHGAFGTVAGGYDTSCAIRSDGTLACWGSSWATGPTNPPAGSFRALTADGGDQFDDARTFVIDHGGHACAIRGDGTVACWGYDRWGQASPPGGAFTALSAGVSHTCGIAAAGILVCWGDDRWGQSTVPPTFDDEQPTTPGTPALTGGARPANTGVFGLAWAPATDPDPADTVTYSLQHRDARSAYADARTGLAEPAHAFTAAAPEAEGTWTYRARAVDNRGLAGEYSPDSQPVVVDRSAPFAPRLSLHQGPAQSPVYVDASGTAWYKDRALVDLAANGDPALRDGSPGSGVDPGSLATPFPLSANGVNTTTRTVTDRAGNASAPSASLNVRVDAAPPVVTSGVCTGEVLQGASAVVTVSASDGESGLATNPAGTHRLDTATVGPHQQAFTAVDNVGHVTTITCVYQVVYRFTGFASPIANFSDQTATVNKARAGTVVRLKFSLGSDQGPDVIDPAGPTSAPIPGCAALTTPLAGTERTATPDGGPVSYDPKADQYTYSWLTDAAWADTCRQFVLRLDDGTEHRANFRFTR